LNGDSHTDQSDYGGRGERQPSQDQRTVRLKSAHKAPRIYHRKPKAD
jgi:hypothetical protein